MSYASQVLADSPYLFWQQDELAGVTATDSSPNGRNGTYTGGPILGQAGLIDVGTAVLYDALDDVCIGSTIFNQAAATVEVWFTYDGTPPAALARWLIAGCNSGAAFDKIVAIDQNNKAVFHVFDGANKLAVGATVLSAGSYYLAGTVSGGTARIFVNGVQDGTVAASTSFTGYAAANVVVAGHAGSPTAGQKVGVRDQFAIYAADIGADRIAAHYAARITDPSAAQVLGPQRMRGT